MKKIIVILLLLVMLVGTIAIATANSNNENDDITILFTNDMHSNLEELNGTGGFGKIATFIDETKEENPNTFVLDAGDFSMGTPFQVTYQEIASELRMMGELGYDATVFGNHEFDYRTTGLTNMLTAAVESGDALPKITIANIDWEATFAVPELEENARALKEACDRYGVKDYTIIEKNGIKIGVFGIMGQEADEYAPESGLIFADQVESAKRVVEQIESNEDVDMIVCISHSGLNFNDPSKSEDEILAKEVDGIDFIASGHTHDTLLEPIIHNDTVIGAASEYTKYVGKVVFEKTEDEYTLKEYELIPMDNSIEEKESVVTTIQGYRDLLDNEYFAKFGYTIDEVLASNPYEFTPFEMFSKEQGEDTLGNILSDGTIYGIKEAEGEDYIPEDVAIVPGGVIRETLYTGDVTTRDVFNILSLGIGPDGVPGYPMVSVYITGAELKTAAEVDISVSEIMSAARLYMSGLQYSYNPNRLILNRVLDVELVREDGTFEEIEDDKLYRIVGDLYSCQMLGTVEDQSFGLLKLVPKDKDGNPIENFEEHLIRFDNGSELKQWHAVAMYFDSFENDTVPAEYNELEGRKEEIDSKNIVDLLKNPNKIFWMLSGALLAIILILVALVLVIKRVIKKKRKKN